MSKLVKYGGAAPADDNCLGKYDRIYESMKKVAMLLICSSPSLAIAGREFIKTSKYKDEYAIVVDAFSKIFTIIDEASIDLAGRRDKCTNLSDVAWGMLGMKQCNKGNAKMEGFFGLIVDFFKNNLGGTSVVAALSTSNGILAVYTTMRNFIARMLTNVMCAIYYNGSNGMVGTWVIAKAIIQTIGEFAKAGGILSTNIALGIGVAILNFVTGLGRWKKNEFTIPNDTPAIEDVENNIANIDGGVAVNDGGVATGLSDAVDELENIEYHEKGGDELINDYIDDVEQIERDFADNANNLEIMKEYLMKAINDTEKGGPEYEEHKEFTNIIKQISGKWRTSTDMHDLGDASLMADSEPMKGLFDDDFDDDPMERTLSDGNTPKRDSVPYSSGKMAGIINKKDSKFIKNLNKSMKKMRRELKSKNAGYNYIQKNKVTKKNIRHRNINPGFSKKKADKKTKGLGKDIRTSKRTSKRNTKRHTIRRGRG